MICIMYISNLGVFFSDLLPCVSPFLPPAPLRETSPFINAINDHVIAELISECLSVEPTKRPNSSQVLVRAFY